MEIKRNCGILHCNNPTYRHGLCKLHSRQGVRKDVLEHYSLNKRPMCANCANDTYVHLTIDHIHGGGAEHLRKIKYRGSSFYFWLQNNGYPEGYQVLCWNCNCTKHLVNENKLTNNASIWYHKLRIRALEHYSSNQIPTCVCCKNTTLIHLTLDHIDGGGRKHARNTNDTRIGHWLWKNNYPDGFQVLCWNCNEAKHLLGRCPCQDGRV